MLAFKVKRQTLELNILAIQEFIRSPPNGLSPLLFRWHYDHYRHWGPSGKQYEYVKSWHVYLLTELQDEKDVCIDIKPDQCSDSMEESSMSVKMDASC